MSKPGRDYSTECQGKLGITALSVKTSHNYNSGWEVGAYPNGKCMAYDASSCVEEGPAAVLVVVVVVVEGVQQKASPPRRPTFALPASSQMKRGGMYLSGNMSTGVIQDGVDVHAEVVRLSFHSRYDASFSYEKSEEFAHQPHTRGRTALDTPPKLRISPFQSSAFQ
ncbi:hypothetical protein O3P69_003273 [Scylla paramamosain]|uniref:Uncharacterized protein n=1 Tax=Scylla paramamosain TaxID=85552 RepID=A0AAW0UMP3_SCYPA